MRRKGKKLNKQERKIEERRKYERRREKKRTRIKAKEIIDTLIDEIDGPTAKKVTTTNNNGIKWTNPTTKARKKRARRKRG